MGCYRNMIKHMDLAILCDKAYDRDSNNIWKIDGIEVLVRIKYNCIRLAVRGTEMGIRDMSRNLKFYPYKGESKSWGHAGFKKSASKWVDAFGPAIKQHNLPIIVTGHSLGASTAPHMAIRLIDLGCKVQEVVTFAEPKGFYWGGNKYYQSLGIPTTSYLTRNDWIRLTPPWGETCVKPTYLKGKGFIRLWAHSLRNYTERLSGEE